MISGRVTTISCDKAIPVRKFPIAMRYGLFGKLKIWDGPLNKEAVAERNEAIIR